MKNSVKDNSNTISEKIIENVQDLTEAFTSSESDLDDKSFEESAVQSNVDNATTAILLQSLEDIEKGRHLITVDTKVSKPRIKKLKTEQIEKVENITNTRMNIQRIETFSNNELEL